MKCRHCQSELRLPILDLGSAPPSNAYITLEKLHAPEAWYPLRLLICENCWLVQTEDFVGRETLFNDEYAYFSSYSSSWLEHARKYVGQVKERFNLNTDSLVVEVAANDGYLLQYVKESGIPCLGIEPTACTAAAARGKGIEIFEHFFSRELAAQLVLMGKQADLVVANNVLAHVPDINDFVSAFALLLKPDGVATFEFPYLYEMIIKSQFDTVYHEHYSYLCLSTVERFFRTNAMTIFDVEELPTHGGSLRVYAQREDTGDRPKSDIVVELLKKEQQAGMSTPWFYAGFQARAEQVKNEFLTFLLEGKQQEKTIAAYGAAAKGNTLLNYAGIRPDLVPFVVDKNPAKQGKYLPGSRIPILAPDILGDKRPDYLVILPWNIADEIKQQNEGLAKNGTRFVTAVPSLEII